MGRGMASGFTVGLHHCGPCGLIRLCHRIQSTGGIFDRGLERLRRPRESGIPSWRSPSAGRAAARRLEAFCRRDLASTNCAETPASSQRSRSCSSAAPVTSSAAWWESASSWRETSNWSASSDANAPAARDLAYGQLPVPLKTFSVDQREALLSAQNEYDEPLATLYTRVEWEEKACSDALRTIKAKREKDRWLIPDRKSTRLNSSHLVIS